MGTLNHTAEGQKELERFVQVEIGECQSGLIEMLFEKGIFSIDDVENFYLPQCPECGYQGNDFKEADETNGDDTFWECPSCSKKLDDEPESEAQEILEWWTASDFLIKELRKKGEPILSTDFGDWWGRTTSGQSIFMDSVIEDIKLDLAARCAAMAAGTWQGEGTK